MFPSLALSISKVTNGERIKAKKMNPQYDRDTQRAMIQYERENQRRAENQYQREKAENDRELEVLREAKKQSGKILSCYKKEQFCDVQIKAKDDVVVKAHRLILGINSQYFQKMFKPEGEWEKLTEVTVSEFDGVVVKAIVDCIYMNHIKKSLVTKENSKQMLKAGIFFDVETVKEEAAMYMWDHMDETNAIDLLLHDVFTPKMGNKALNYIGQYFQVFMDNDELKNRLLTELNVDTIINLLQQKYLMLWHPNGIYLDGIEREKKLFLFVMAYVAQDKEVRLPELSRLLKALKLPILAVAKKLDVKIMAEGLEVPPEELSGQLADVLEPFDDITGKENLSTMFVTERKSKDKARPAAATRALAETCKMRFATLPHSTSCSDLIMANTPYNERLTYCPDNPDNNSVIYSSKKMIKSITICKPNLAAWKPDATTDLEKEMKKLQINGIRIKWDDDTEEALGSKDKENIEETYTLDEGVLITELLTYHMRGSLLPGNNEFQILGKVQDMSFTTNKEKSLGPMISTINAGSTVGLRLKVPAKMRTLEQGCPGVFYWLQGFGMEELKEDEGKSSTNCFYPIWGFQTHFKCYELSKQDFEFVAGIKKCHQFSVEGMSENPMINNVEDFTCLERTPVHEVVDLGDSDEDDEPEAGPSNMNDDSIMMIDSDSDHTEDGSDDEEDSDDDDYDEDDHAHLLRAGSGEDVGQGTDSPFNADILDEDDDDEDIGRPGNMMSSELIEIPSSSEPDVDPPNMEDVSEDILDDETETDKTEKEAKSKDKTPGKKSPSKVDKKKKSSEDTVEISKMDDNEEKAEDNKEKEEATESAKDQSKKSVEEEADDTKTVKGKGKGKGKTPAEKEGEKEDTDKENKVEEKPDDLSRSKRGKNVEEEKEEKESDTKNKTKGKKTLEKEETDKKESPSKKKSEEKADKEEKSTKEKDEKESPSKKKAKGKESEAVVEEPKSSKRGRNAVAEEKVETESPSKKKAKGKASEEKVEEPKSSKRGRNAVSEEKEAEAKTSKRKKR